MEKRGPEAEISRRVLGMEAIRSALYVSSLSYNGISHALQTGADYDIGLGQFKDAIPSRQLILALLTELWNMGWTLETAQPVFLYSENRDSMFFKQVLPRPTAPRQFFALGIAESDKLRVYNWPNDEVDKAIAYVLRVSHLC
jgi:hypothetical protein